MGASVTSNPLHRPTISVSVPPSQQEAFYRALMRLKQEGDAAFVSASALIVKAVIHYAEALDSPNGAVKGVRDASDMSDTSAEHPLEDRHV